jgi:hypothetical protein
MSVRPTIFVARMILSRASALQPSPDDPFGRALCLRPRRDRIEFGRVEEIDALLEGVVHLGVAFGLGVLLTPGHGAETDGRDLQIGAAETTIFHKAPPAGASTACERIEGWGTDRMVSA